MITDLELEMAAKRLALLELRHRLIGQDQITLQGVLWMIEKLMKEYR